jgi:hypothetical protein
MNMFFLPSTQRILEWRKFRQTLGDLSESEQLTEICKFWANAPLTTYALDWDAPESWPTAWQLISEGNFDSIVIAYLMEQTLILAGWDPSRMKLAYLHNNSIADQMMVVLVDDKWLLNYSIGEVYDYTKIKNDCVLMVKYQIREGKRVQL